MKEAVRKFKETIEIKSSVFNRVREHRYFSIGTLCFVFLLIACFHVWQRVRVVSLVREVAVLKKTNDSLMDDKKKLYSDVAALSMVTRIEKYAADSLGLQSVSADKLFTLVKKNNEAVPDDLELMFTAIKRVTDYLPVVEQTRASAKGVENIKIDTVDNVWGD